MKAFFTTILLIAAVSIGSSALAQTTTVYTTNTGEKYHKEGCRYLAKSKIETTLQEATDAGYTACGVCIGTDHSSAKSSTAPSTPVQKPSAATQCTATTQAGNQCKRNATSGSDKCWQHE